MFDSLIEVNILAPGEKIHLNHGLDEEYLDECPLVVRLDCGLVSPRT
jgi:hypothetical protein